MLFDKKTYVATGLILSILFLGCSDQSDSKATASKSQVNKTGDMQTASSAGHHESDFEGATLKGIVLETFNSGGYTYLKLDTGEDEIWAATTQAEVQKGESIELNPGPVMQDFYSKTLDRTFSEIVFSSGIKGGSSGSSGHQMTGMMDNHGNESVGQSGDEPSFEEALESEGMGSVSMPEPGSSAEAQSGGSLKAVTSAEDISVEKSSAANGYTIEEIYSKAVDLDGKKVQVRGKVIKVSPNIMGKTWIHLQDGTGDAMKNTHDLVFTSQAMPSKGETIILEGTLAKDKDFGAGYRYKAIVEKAEIIK